MPRWRMASESWICCEEKLPFLLKITFMHKNAMAIAIINVAMTIFSTIFITFAGAKLRN
jgi:hypothetical protein